MKYLKIKKNGVVVNIVKMDISLLKEKQKITLLALNKNNYLPKKTTEENVLIKRIPFYNKNTLTKIFSRIIIISSHLINVLGNDIILIYGKVAGFNCLIISCWLFRKKTIFRSVLFGYDDIDSLVKKSRIKKFIYKKINIY